MPADRHVKTPDDSIEEEHRADNENPAPAAPVRNIAIAIFAARLWSTGAINVLFVSGIPASRIRLIRVPMCADECDTPAMRFLHGIGTHNVT